jgi:prepilin-type N-terminal cleavage/methylation domain-containing protein
MSAQEGVLTMRNDKRGFSLIELMIAVTILGILAAVAIPTYMGIQKKGKQTEYKTNLEVLRLLQEKRHAETGEYSLPAATTVAVKGEFPEFQPGNPAELLYEYSVGFTADRTLDFWVMATGKAGTPDAGKKYCIDEQNQKSEGAGCP